MKVMGMEILSGVGLKLARLFLEVMSARIDHSKKLANNRMPPREATFTKCVAAQMMTPIVMGSFSFTLKALLGT